MFREWRLRARGARHVCKSGRRRVACSLGPSIERGLRSDGCGEVALFQYGCCAGSVAVRYYSYRQVRVVLRVRPEAASAASSDALKGVPTLGRVEATFVRGRVAYRRGGVGSVAGRLVDVDGADEVPSW